MNAEQRDAVINALCGALPNYQLADVARAIEVLSPYLTAPKAARKVQTAPADTAELSTEAIYAHYKRTAPYYDLQAFMRLTLSEALQREALALFVQVDADGKFTGTTAADWRRRYNLLHQHWRGESNARDRRERAGSKRGPVLAAIAASRAARGASWYRQWAQRDAVWRKSEQTAQLKEALRAVFVGRPHVKVVDPWQFDAECARVVALFDPF